MVSLYTNDTLQYISMSIDLFYSKNGSEITCKPSSLTPEPVGIISLQYVPYGDILVDYFYLHKQRTHLL